MQLPYVLLALNTLDETCTIAGFALSRLECLAQQDRVPGATHYKVIQIADDMGPALRKWFGSCGITTSESNELVRELGKSMREMLDRIRE